MWCFHIAHKINSASIFHLATIVKPVNKLYLLQKLIWSRVYFLFYWLLILTCTLISQTQFLLAPKICLPLNYSNYHEVSISLVTLLQSSVKGTACLRKKPGTESRVSKLQMYCSTIIRFPYATIKGEVSMAYFLLSRTIHRMQDHIRKTNVNQLTYVMLQAWEGERERQTKQCTKESECYVTGSLWSFQ